MTYPKERNYFILDFETTGLAPTNNYPIEIGLIITDSKLTILDKFESLIFWQGLVDKHVIVGANSWLEKYVPAFEVHKISFQEEYLRCSILNCSVKNIISNISSMAAKYTINNKNKPVIISDNSIFEFGYLQKMFNFAGDDFFNHFHYSVWDTNLLLNNCKTAKDPKPVHRAFDDVALLYKELVKSYNELNWF